MREEIVKESAIYQDILKLGEPGQDVEARVRSLSTDQLEDLGEALLDC
jgi:hypothetical protein